MSNQTNIKNDHTLYHEAKRRATQAQPIKRWTIGGSLLLLAPNNIICELFNTVVKDISSERLLEFITNNLMDYLEQNWTNKITQQIFKRLKREQAVDIKAGLSSSIPLIKISTASIPLSPTSPPPPKSSPPPPPADKRANQPHKKLLDMKMTMSRSRSTSNSPDHQKSPPLSYTRQDSKLMAIRQIYEHIMWRIRTENVTQITSLLVKLALDDGYKRGKLKVETFDDVARNFEIWRSNLLIKLYSFGDAPANDQKLILSSTNKGDLTKWLANYIDGSEKRQNLDLIRKLASALRDRTNNCIYLTNDLNDGLKSLQTGSIRLVLIVDRTKQYEPIQSIQDYESTIEPLISSGKLYIISSLDCVKFAPDPTNETCC